MTRWYTTTTKAWGREEKKCQGRVEDHISILAGLKGRNVVKPFFTSHKRVISNKETAGLRGTLPSESDEEKRVPLESQIFHNDEC